MVHDVCGSLVHLCALVQRGVSPSSSLCVICSRSADNLADGSKDDVIVFRCSNQYIQCAYLHALILAQN